MLAVWALSSMVFCCTATTCMQLEAPTPCVFAMVVHVLLPGTLFEGADLTETIWEDALIGEQRLHHYTHRDWQQQQ